MIEAVGREYWATYFQTVANKLKPGGYACIQSIVIQDERFERYIQGTDFIQQYIFPGGCLPSPQIFREEAMNAGLVVQDEFHFGSRLCANPSPLARGFCPPTSRCLEARF